MADGRGGSGKSEFVLGIGGGVSGFPGRAGGAVTGSVSGVAADRTSSAIDDDDASVVGGEIAKSLDAA